MVKKTTVYRLPYLEAGDSLTPVTEQQRFVTVDTQLEALYRLLGDGIITGWNLSMLPALNADGTQSAAARLSVYVSAGKGHVASLAAETKTTTTVIDLVDGTTGAPSVNYIYAQAVYDINRTPPIDTPSTKNVNFVSLPSKSQQNNLLYLGSATVANGYVTSINTDDRVSLTFTALLLTALAAHKHRGGAGDPSKIDLESEVKGILASANIEDLDASKITSGTIPTDRFSLSHNSLSDIGTLSHADIDTIITNLQNNYAELFGDITATNLLQMVLTVKNIYEEADRYFRNTIAIIPGVGNCTDGNPDTYIDVTNTTATVDYVNKSIKGVAATGTDLFYYTLNTSIEYLRGNYDANYISITSDAGYQYGYGYGYGEGLDYFDVFGVGSGVDTIRDVGYSYGYGTPAFESMFNDAYGYGYGYQWTEGGSSISGAVDVTMNRGSSDATVYDKDDGDTINTIASTATAATDRLNEIYTLAPEEVVDGELEFGLVSAVEMKWSYSSVSDWTNLSNMILNFRNTGNAIVINGDWFLTVTDSEGVSSNAITISGLTSSDVDTIPTSNNYNINISVSNLGSVDKTKINTFKIWTNLANNYVGQSDDPTVDFDIVNWDGQGSNTNGLVSIGLSGTLYYSSIDSNNRINQLYLVLPVTGTWNDISWIADEVSDSKVIIRTRTVNAQSGEDGFVLLTALNDDEGWGYGNPYCNTDCTLSNSGYTTEPASFNARGTGSAITEAPGTHMEIEVTLQSSSDGLIAPILHSLTIGYSTDTTTSTIVIDTEDEFNEGTGVNIEFAETVPGTLQIEKITNVASRYAATTGEWSEYNKNTSGIYEKNTQPYGAGSNIPLTREQIVAGDTTGSFGQLTTIRKLTDQSIWLADATNNRLVKVDSDGNFVQGIYGATSSSGTISDFYAILCYYNVSDATLYVGFTHPIDGSTVNLDKFYFLDGDTIATLNSLLDTTEIINSTILKVTLSSISVALLNSLDTPYVIGIEDGGVTSTDTTATFSEIKSNSVSVNQYNVHFRPLYQPIDIFMVSDTDMFVAQHIDSSAPSDLAGQPGIFRITTTAPAINTDSINTYTISGTSYQIAFDLNTLGSIQRIPDASSTTGAAEWLIADSKNQRIVILRESDKAPVWYIDTSIPSNSSHFYIPTTLYPTCVRYGTTNRKFYVSLSDNLSGSGSKIYEITVDKIARELTGVALKNPKEIQYINSNRILITS